MKTGCIFDNHRGIYMGEAIIELAESYGMPHEEERTSEHEFYHEATDSAVDWLNNNIAEDGHSYGFGECGDFFYMPSDWWEDEFDFDEEDEE